MVRFFFIAAIVASSWGLKIGYAAPVKLGLPPYASATCAAFLVNAADIAEELSRNGAAQDRAATRDSYKFLESFRRRHLPEPFFNSESKLDWVAYDIQTDENSASDGEKQDLSNHLRTLEADYLEEYRHSDVNFFRGFQVRGAKAIGAFAESLRRDTTALNESLFKNRGNVPLVLLGLHQLLQMRGAVFGPAGMLLLNRGLVEWGHEPTVQAAMLMLFGLSGAAYSFEHFSRFVTARDWQFDGEMKNMKLVAESLERDRTGEREWIYRSQRYRMPSIIGDTYEYANRDGYLMTRAEMRMVDHQSEIARTAAGLLGSNGREKYSYVFVDRLLSRDPLTGEAVLTIFIRGTRDEQHNYNPPGGRRKRVAVDAVEEQLERAAVPIPVRAGKGRRK